jgi:phage repressor protein C with HTH and peptisase S24 domain
MLIRFTREQQDSLLEWAGAFTSSELEQDVEPSGYRILLEFAPPEGVFAIACKGDSMLELGEVVVQLD